jgi:hypothetical protein
LLGVNSTDTLLQGVSTSSILPVGEVLGLVSGVFGLRLEKKALLGYARQIVKKSSVRASEAGTGAFSNQEMQAPKHDETSTETLKRLRSDGSTPTETARAPKRPRHSSRPGTLGGAEVLKDPEAQYQKVEDVLHTVSSKLVSDGGG